MRSIRRVNCAVGTVWRAPKRARWPTVD
jgi:hypothetical protein